MKAWVIEKHGSIEGLALVDWPEPAIADDDVLVSVRSVSLNYRDLVTVLHENPSNVPLPLIPCSDGAGEVVAVGKNVSRFKAGDRVVGTFFQNWIDGLFEMEYHKASGGGSIHGWLCESIAVPEHALLPLLDHFSYEEAATLPCAGVTAWAALFPRGNLQADKTVLALGTGGVSIFALQLAVAAGAKVIITSSSDEKLERTKSLGAWGTVNYVATPDWEKAVKQLTNRRGVDHVVEVGGSGTLPKSIASVAASGQIALIGVLTGTGAPNGSLFPLVTHNARLDGIYVGSRNDQEALMTFMEKHEIHPIIDCTFPFAEADAAFAYLESGKHFGKVTISL